MAELTLSEALEKIKTYEAKFTKMNSDIEGLTTYVAEAKKAEADAKKKAEAEAKKGDAESEEEKMAEAKKMLKAATEEQDPEKVREKIAEATKKMGMYKKAEAEKDEDEKKDDEEKEAMKAELKKPRLQVLTAAYKAQKVDDKIIAEFTAQWNKMSFTELDSEIAKIKPFMGKTISTSTATAIPLGFSTPEVPYQGSTKDEYSAKIHEMSDSDLFGGKL